MAHDPFGAGDDDDCYVGPAPRAVRTLGGCPSPVSPGPNPVSSVGLPTGGTINQVLTKKSNINFDAIWADPTGSGVEGITLEDLTWDNILNTPNAFVPIAHTHVISNVTGLQEALDAKQVSGSYSLTSHDHAGVYALVAHTHAIGDVTGLQTALDSKQVAGSYAVASHTHDDRYYTETEVNTLLAGKQAAGSYAPLAHIHVIGDTTGLQSALDGKSATTHNHDGVYSLTSHNHTGVYAPVSHTHVIADVTSLQSTLDAKQNIAGINEIIDDRVAAFLVQGSNITLTHDDTANTLTIASSSGGITDPYVPADGTMNVTGALSTTGQIYAGSNLQTRNSNSYDLRLSHDGDSGWVQNVKDGVGWAQLNFKGSTLVFYGAASFDATISAAGRINPAAGLFSTGGTFGTLANNQGGLYSSADGGLVLYGQGDGTAAGKDVVLMNRLGGPQLYVNQNGVTATKIAVTDEAYGVGWNGSLEVPTKNAIYDKLETYGTSALKNMAVGTVAPTSPAVNDLWVDTN